ncbi:DUF3486 family protein [Desulfonatronovibrio hydrogenovorans]|uniref:DUF3486 family protein n=1 Tax=Desulfonatronovibrio hydrogenovorans TaxID=53245 RepID=UPI00068CFA05|nr:DUF3486 family protein [Desulfonatronovibrio hydrogenovorans]
MPRKSTVQQISPEAREELDKMVRDGRATIDQIRDRLLELEGEEAPSRSAIGRYVKSAQEQMEKYRQAQEIARTWVGKLEEEPDGDVGRLLSEMLRTVAFSTMGQMGENEKEADPKDISYLARTIKDLASADKISADRELRIRQETASRAADKAVKVAKKGGLSSEAVQEIRKEILGVA